MAYFDERYTSNSSVPKEEVSSKEHVVAQFDAFSAGFDRPYNIPVKMKKQKIRKERRVGRTILCTILILVLVAGSCLTTAYFMNEYWTGRYNSLNQSMRESLEVIRQQLDDMQSPGAEVQTPKPSYDGVGLTVDQIYENNVDAVVAINCTLQERYYGQIAESESNGSGFIISEDGYVVTNYHVIEGSTHISVICHDGAKFDAVPVGYDQANDIALLKVEAVGLPAVKIGNSGDLKVGDQVCAIGNSLGIFASSLTVGYVSGKDRIVTTEGTSINMIQTDTAINPGNSGGPLFNMQGEVVGITSVKYSGSSSGGVSIEGMGFAIPIDDVIGMLDDLRQYGHITGAYMGVSIRNVEASVQEYGIPAGVFVSEVEPNSAAMKAGVLPKDVIVNLGGYEIENMTQLSLALRKYKAGDTASLTVFRAGETVSLTITFDEKPVQQEAEEAQTTEPETIPFQEFDFDYFSELFPWFG